MILHTSSHVNGVFALRDWGNDDDDDDDAVVVSESPHASVTPRPDLPRHDLPSLPPLALASPVAAA